MYGLMPEIRRILARTYLDTAASPFLYAPDVYEIACRIMGPDKILFGSDYPAGQTPKEAVEAVKRLPIGQDFKEKILGKNAQKILGL